MSCAGLYQVGWASLERGFFLVHPLLFFSSIYPTYFASADDFLFILLRNKFLPFFLVWSFLHWRASVFAVRRKAAPLVVLSQAAVQVFTMAANLFQRFLSLVVLVLLGVSQLASALPTASEEPSRTLNARDTGSNTVADNVFAAAAMNNAKSKGFGGGANKENQCNLSQAKLPAGEHFSAFSDVGWY